MNIKSLTRDKQFVLSNLKQTKDNKVITALDCKIVIPQRFEQQHLAVIADTIQIVGIYALVMGDKYSVCNVCAMQKISPASINKIKIDEEDYYEFAFPAGSVVIEDTMLIKNNKIPYYIYNEFIAKGRVPWYVNYEDFGSVYDTSLKHANLNLNKNPELTRMLISIVARDSADRTKYYRTITGTKGKLRDPVFVGLKNVTYTATNTLNKLAGSYMQDGIVSALNTPSTRKERLETILTK